MAARVIILTGSASEALSGPMLPREMVEDFLTISRLQREQIEQIATALESETGFLDTDKLKQSVQDVIPDEGQSSAICRVIHNIRPESAEPALAALREWRQADEKNAKYFPESAFSALRENLPRLIRIYPAWDRYRKARRLSSITGNSVRQVELICDARPVFDRDRNQIEGFVPLITLKLVYETQTEEAGCIEFVLAEEMLSELLEKATKAMKKMAIHRQSLGFVETKK